MELQLLEHRRFTKLFVKSVKKCTNKAQVYLGYCILKVVSAVILLSLEIGCGWNDNHTWMTIVVFTSCLGVLCQILLLTILKKPSLLLQIAEDLIQVIYVEQEMLQELPNTIEALTDNNQQEQTEQELIDEYHKNIILSSQIKIGIIQQHRFLRIILNIEFFLNQCLVIWGFVLISDKSKFTQQCSEAFQIYTCVFLCFSIFIYLNVYITTVFVIILLPFLFIYILYLKIKNNQKSQDVKKIIENIKKNKVIKYQPDTIPGDQECKICYQTYQLGDNIFLLPCHETHNFHELCLETWFQVNLTCPVCRKNFLEINNEQVDNQNLENINEQNQ